MQTEVADITDTEVTTPQDPPQVQQRRFQRQAARQATQRIAEQSKDISRAPEDVVKNISLYFYHI